jgi:hypothetical protein
MERSCLLVVGKKDVLDRLINERVDSKQKDYMKQVYSIPINKTVAESAIELTSTVKKCDNVVAFNGRRMNEDEILYPGYCGEECRRFLLDAGLSEYYTIAGVESPGFGWKTFDIVFPQGRCEKGEVSSTTAVREFMEETGIKLDNIKFDEVEYKKGNTPTSGGGGEPKINVLRHITLLGFVGVRKEMSVYLYKVGIN